VLCKKTFLEKSKLGGIGLFADENINEGEFIWKDDRRTTITWSIEDWNKLKNEMPMLAFNNIARFVYLFEGVYYLNLDDSRFMNHSDNGNMGWNKTNVSCYALRNIKKGEELTISYVEFCDSEDTFYLEKDTYVV